MVGIQPYKPCCCLWQLTGLRDAVCIAFSVKAAYESAVELFAYLCKLYGLDPLSDGVIVSHREGCERGIASNHGDPEHLWKGLNMGYTMDLEKQLRKRWKQKRMRMEKRKAVILYGRSEGAHV